MSLPLPDARGVTALGATPLGARLDGPLPARWDVRPPQAAGARQCLRAAAALAGWLFLRGLAVIAGTAAAAALLAALLVPGALARVVDCGPPIAPAGWCAALELPIPPTRVSGGVLLLDRPAWLPVGADGWYVGEVAAGWSPVGTLTLGPGTAAALTWPGMPLVPGVALAGSVLVSMRVQRRLSAAQEFLGGPLPAPLISWRPRRAHPNGRHPKV